MAVKPQAVALVSSGSRGNKLLFYDSGIAKPHSLESELLNKLPQRTLAEILASCAVMQDRKFELRVDEWKFVGHPFLLQTSSWSISFNIAFVLQSTCSPEAVGSYNSLSRALGAALIHEEHRTEFFKNQYALLMQISDQVDTIDELSQKAVVSSYLAKTLHEALCGLQNGDPHVHVIMNDWSEISCLIHSEAPPTVPQSLTSSNTIAPKSIVRSYSAVILLTSFEDLTKRLPPSCNPSFHRFLTTISPLKNLIQVSLDADIPLQQAVKFACHLVHWGQAMTVYPLSETNVYINSPQADTKRDSQLASLFAKEFSSVAVDDSESLSEGADDSLSQFLFHFSAPVTLSEMRGLYTDEKLIPIVTWLLKHGQILQLHTYIFLIPPQDTKDRGMFDDDEEEEGENEPVHLSPETMANLLKHLSKEEVEWVSSTDAARDKDDLALFTKLSCYWHGNHHLEEILMLENMARSELLALIDKFSEILTTASIPERT
ncbi:PREDICTED: nitrogen permease regulator 3-like protein [Amphimedon queenslandica]|uniref:GATOR complex protein NPRL3 n=1 Tax=Amphimedon queenslandica TaxID=400682 RepID=A0A1X7VPA3_AMPQE|nr:PREDICTED: nitrogen permease regulator 3-like protein [Amphimedon queenslandica]|eukprot:XP_003383272.2 PREDICTED: nitrogen permease regulator 3-like protein [Amphimedon queenslandica]